MIQEKSTFFSKVIVIDLTGPQGNAFYLLGTAKDLANQLDLDGEAIVKEMMESESNNVEHRGNKSKENEIQEDEAVFYF